MPPIPRWKLVTGLVVIVVVSAAVGTVLWWPATRGLNGAELVTARFDAVKVALGIAVGSGGLFALYLAWRRQRSTEADLDNRERALAHQLQVAADTKAHQERVALNTEADAQARRITDLYMKAVEQIGSDKAAVRLGGLYALERVAQDNPEQRQTVVNVLCAYLRMPYLPAEEFEREDDEGWLTEDEARRHEEREVRLTAQRLIQNHLTPSDATVFWSGIELDLSGASLVDFSLAHCTVTRINCTLTRFYGGVDLTFSTFATPASFYRAWFGGDVFCLSTTFYDGAYFTGASFLSNVEFSFARFIRLPRAQPDPSKGLSAVAEQYAMPRAHVVFKDVTFAHPPQFQGARFEDGVPPEIAPYVDSELNQDEPQGG